MVPFLRCTSGHRLHRGVFGKCVGHNGGNGRTSGGRVIGGLITLHLRGTGLVKCTSCTSFVLRSHVTGGRRGMCHLLGRV